MFSLHTLSAALRKIGLARGPKMLAFVALEEDLGLGLGLAFGLHPKVASPTWPRPGESPKILGVTHVTGSQTITRARTFFLYC